MIVVVVLVVVVVVKIITIMYSFMCCFSKLERTAHHKQTDKTQSKTNFCEHTHACNAHMPRTNACMHMEAVDTHRRSVKHFAAV